MLNIVHAAPSFVVVDKPSGLLSVPGRGPNMQDCVATRVAAMFPAAAGPLIAHRLDMDTSGLMVVGLTTAAQRALSMQFEARVVRKQYIALVQGRVEADSGEVRLPFRVDIDDRPRQMYDPLHGKIGETRWRVLARQPRTTRLELVPRTGRTHQLRVHAAHRLGLGHPILGDRLYGRADSAPRLMLHASALFFDDPDSGAPLEFSSTVPF